MRTKSVRFGFFTSVIVAFLFLFASSSFAAVLHWSSVDSSQDCVIAGYNVQYGIVSGQYTDMIDVGNVTFYDLDLLNLVPNQTYYFAVNAYSTANLEGPLSTPIPYTHRSNIVPSITGLPSINHINNTIDITFSEANMQGAYVKTNYEFSPTILFDDARDIVRTDMTYRLFMNYIPQRTIITMTINNVTDYEGLALTDSSIVINDDDSDGMADDWESYYGITTSFSDPDSDGLHNSQEYSRGTSPVSNDSDNDGMDDGWEVQNSLNPLLDDADGDIDGDGINNLDEYNSDTGVSNLGPVKPVLSLPGNLSENVQLSPQLRTAAYLDPENDTHFKTQWQISTEAAFADSENILFELETYDSLTRLTVPEFILNTGETYFWRVRFFDTFSHASAWSDPFSFTSVTVNPEDPDGNGVPDVQQVTDGAIDLNEDGSFDVSSITYKMVTDGTISYGLEASSNVTIIDDLKFIDPDEISDTFGKPDGLDFGLIQFRIRVQTPGDTAEVRVYFSEPVGANWYKYDLINGWREYSKDYPGNVQFSSDKKSVLLRLVDGGPGDSDGVANGVIVDPSGPGSLAASSAGSGGGGGGGGCFIATAAFGSPMETHIQVLRDFRDTFLLKTRLGTAIVSTYYKYSPPIADVVARHSILKAVVRVGLIPFIVFGYIVVHIAPFQQGVILLLVVSLTAMAFFRATRHSSPEDTKDLSDPCNSI